VANCQDLNEKNGTNKARCQALSLLSGNASCEKFCLPYNTAGRKCLAPVTQTFLDDLPFNLYNLRASALMKPRRGLKNKRESPSGKASAFQADIRGFESRLPLKRPMSGIGW
jgi:hypothetical protein